MASASHSLSTEPAGRVSVFLGLRWLPAATIALALVLALSVTALAGCGGGDTGGTTDQGADTAKDTFTFAQGADPRGLDPARVDDLESGKVIVNIYEGLTKYAADSTQVEPCLAESWEVSDDGLTYTFKLRQGVKFHDGTDFNADAVKTNIERQLPPKVDDNMPYASFTFGTVKDVEVVDPYTVKFIFTEPYAPFFIYMSWTTGCIFFRSLSFLLPTIFVRIALNIWEGLRMGVNVAI